MEVGDDSVATLTAVSPPNYSTSSVTKGSIVSVVIEQVEGGLLVAALKVGDRVMRGVLMDSEKCISELQQRRAQEQAALVVDRKSALQRPQHDVVSIQDRSDYNLLPEDDQVSSGGFTGVNKRGRPCAWKHLHPGQGRCRECALCHRPSEQARYTHPAFWRRGEQNKLAHLGIQLTSCICIACHVSKIKTGLLFRNKSLEPDSKPRALTGKRGRPCSWQLVHPSSGACKKCHLCGRSSWQLRYTHPATWIRALQSEAVRLGLDVATCVCRVCYVSTFKSGKSVHLDNSNGTAELSDQDDPTEGTDLLEESALSDGSASPITNHKSKSSADLLDAAIQNSPPLVIKSSEPILLGSPVQVVSENLVPLKQARYRFKCALPGCTGEVYAHLGHATAATVAAIMDISPDELSNVSNNRVPLCTAHYRSIWRVLRVMPCLGCNMKGQPEMQRQFRSNAEQLARWLDQAGIKHSITAASACCTTCYRQRIDGLRGELTEVTL